MAQDPGESGRAPKWLAPAVHVALLLAAGLTVTLVEYKSNATLGLDSTRYGAASLLLDGRVPYRSLLANEPPGSYAFDALVLGLFGRTMGSEHLAVLLGGAVVYPLVTYAAARSMLRIRWLAFAAALGVVLLFAPVPGVQLAPALVCIALAARWVHTSRVSALFSAGVACGILLAFSVGLFATTAAAVVVTIALRAITGRLTSTGRRRVATFAPIGSFATGTGIGLLPFLAAVAAEGALPTYARFVTRSLGGSLESAVFPVPALSVSAARLYVPLAIVPIVLCLFARAAREEPLRTRAIAGTLLATSIALRLAAPASSPDATHLLLPAADLPLLGAFVLDWAVEVRGKVSLTLADASLAAAMGLLVAALWRLDPGRPAFALASVVAAVVVGAARTQWGPRGARRRLVRVTAPALLLVGLSVALMLSPGRIVADERTGSELSGAYWDPALADELRSAADALRSTTTTGASVFVYPEGAFLYGLSGRTNPTSFVRLGASVSEQDVSRVLRELSEDEPSAVVVRYALAARRARALARITRYLEDRYVEVRRLDAPELWGVWVRRDPPEPCRRLVLSALARDQANPEPRVVPRRGGRELPVLVQRSGTVRFTVDVRQGSSVGFTPSRDADAPEVKRSVLLEADGRTVTVWEGVADGVKRRLTLSAQPAIPAGSAELVLRSPPGLRTEWIEPAICAPAS